MMSALKAALDATGYSFAHYAWAANAKEIKKDHGVYAEDSVHTLYANNKHLEESREGTIDYFTRDDSGTPKTVIEAALDTLDIAWYLNSIQFEEDTGYIHYEWVFEVS